MWHRRVVLTGTLIALLVLCGRAGTAPVFSAASAPESLGPIHVYRDWHPSTGEGKGQLSSGDLSLARNTRERPRDPYPGWYEWPICLRGYAGHAPASEAWEDPEDQTWWYEWPYCLRGFAGASDDLA
jgi:hypothetical protein